MSTQDMSTQLWRLQACVRDLSRMDIDIQRAEIPDSAERVPRVYVQPNCRLQRLPGAVYKVQGTASGRIEHHVVPLGGCQVRWQQPA